jgi:hypothetical protein
MTDAVREKLVEVVARAMCHEDGSEELIVDGMKMWQLRWDDSVNFIKAIEEQGYRIVPMEPTEEMIEAVKASRKVPRINVGDVRRSETTGIYRDYEAMLDAAPKVVP